MILHSLSSFTNFIGKIPETQRNTKSQKKRYGLTMLKEKCPGYLPETPPWIII
jgi:hypothetical protein